MIEEGAGQEDRRWMTVALGLAARADYRTSPNPMVGAVVLDALGRPVGEGFHERVGLAHAEVVALQQAGERARGGTLYVTLEPCAHHGRTPPCSEAIIRAQVRRVVAAIPDPNPAVNGSGLARLLAAGIEVQVGVGEADARRLNAFFLRRARTGRPFVSAKFAASLDGRIATSSGRSRWITGAAARRHGHRLRHEHDAVLVGVGTVLADDPLLTVRELPEGDPASSGPGPRQPLRIVLDAGLRTPAHARVLGRAQAGVASTLIATTPGVRSEAMDHLRDAGAEIEVLPAAQRPGAGPGGSSRPRVDLPALLDLLARRGLISVLVEGGSEVHGAFFAEDLVDRVHAYLAPCIIGGASAPGSVGGAGFAEIEQALRLDELEVTRIGEDLLVEGDVHGHH